MILAACALAALLIAGAVWQSTAARADKRRYPAPGSIVRGLHVRCSGEGQPVVLEAGIAASSVGWALVQPGIAEFAHVCSYDRPGLAWSPRAGKTCTVDGYMRGLRSVIRHAGRPAILVGHSFGGLLVRLYAARYPGEVAAIVLVDPALLLEWADPEPRRRTMLRRGVALSRRGAWLARIGLVRLSLNLLTGGARSLPKLFARMSSGKGAPVTERLVGEVRKLPPELWPVVKSHWSRPSAFLSMADHLESLPAVAAELARTPVPKDVPTVVISGGHLSSEQLAEHRALGTTRHIIATGSGHWVHLDNPALIVAAVRELVHG